MVTMAGKDGLDGSLGAVVRRYRTTAGLTQPQLAKLVGISGGFMSNIETGERNPGGDTLARLSAVLAIPESDRDELERLRQAAAGHSGDLVSEMELLRAEVAADRADRQAMMAELAELKELLLQSAGRRR